MSPRLKAAAVALSSIAIAMFAVLLLSGLLYEQAQRARDRKLFTQVGRSVDIGGRTLDLDCAGTGQPAIILARGVPWTLGNPRALWQNGLPRPGYGWVAVQRELAKITTVCWYDRAGSGWSDLGPYPRDSSSQARDLHALLRAAGVPSPYVLVAESSAALDARVYAGFYPAEAAGLVFVNGVHPDLLRNGRPGGGRVERLPSFVGHSQDAMAQAFNLVGLYRLGLPRGAAPDPVPQGMTAAEWNTIWRLTQSAKSRSALLQEIGAWAQSTAEARAAGTLGDRPLLVLSATQTEVESGPPGVWAQLQTDLASLSTRGKLVTVDAGGSDLIYTAPAAIIDATREVFAELVKNPR
jgi:pimeloyl-ACP methyl ester carboxylesterase